jgi:TolA-binding protein
LCGLRINSNKRKSFLVEKHEAEIQELKNEISEYNIRISELEQLNILLQPYLEVYRVKPQTIYAKLCL